MEEESVFWGVYAEEEENGVGSWVDGQEQPWAKSEKELYWMSDLW